MNMDWSDPAALVAQEAMVAIRHCRRRRSDSHHDRCLFLGSPNAASALPPRASQLPALCKVHFVTSFRCGVKWSALNTIYLDALEGGRVERIFAQPGDTVTQGQPLFKLSNTELELDVLDRESRLIASIHSCRPTKPSSNRIASRIRRRSH